MDLAEVGGSMALFDAQVQRMLSDPEPFLDELDRLAQAGYDQGGEQSPFAVSLLAAEARRDSEVARIVVALLMATGYYPEGVLEKDRNALASTSDSSDFVGEGSFLGGVVSLVREVIKQVGCEHDSKWISSLDGVFDETRFYTEWMFQFQFYGRNRLDGLETLMNVAVAYNEAGDSGCSAGELEFRRAVRQVVEFAKRRPEVADGVVALLRVVGADVEDLSPKSESSCCHHRRLSLSQV